MVCASCAGRPGRQLEFCIPFQQDFWLARSLTLPSLSPTPRCAAVRAAAAPASARLSSVSVFAAAPKEPVSLKIDPNDPTNYTLGILGDLHMDPRDTAHSYEAGTCLSVFFTWGKRGRRLHMWDRAPRPLLFLSSSSLILVPAFYFPHNPPTPLPFVELEGRREKNLFTKGKKKKEKKNSSLLRKPPLPPTKKKEQSLENRKSPLM